MFQVQSYLPLSIVNYGVSKHYAGSMVSDRCPLGYLFHFLMEGLASLFVQFNVFDFVDHVYNTFTLRMGGLSG